MRDVTIDWNLPQGWLPAGAAVLVLARLDEDSGSWESVLPEYSIAGMGPSPDDALVNAIELLGDYLSLCARDGKSFDEARRPISRRTSFPIARELAGLIIGSKLHRPPRRRHDREQEYRVPLSLVGAAH